MSKSDQDQIEVVKYTDASGKLEYFSVSVPGMTLGPFSSYEELVLESAAAGLFLELKSDEIQTFKVQSEVVV